MANKKVFDVSHPKEDNLPSTTPKVSHKIMLKDPVAEPTESTSPALEETTEKAIDVTVSRQATTITPLSDLQKPDEEVSKTSESEALEVTEKPDETAPTVAEPTLEDSSESEVPTTEPVALADVKTSEPEKEPASEVTSPVTDKEEPIKEVASTDSILPDTSQRATAAAKDSMESPAMFDTKAYYVPIGNSRHKHGGVFGTIVAGIVASLLVVGGILYFAKYM